MARGRDAAKRRQWQERLRRFAEGDATVAEFCRREGVAAASFYQWRQKLGGAKRTASGKSPQAFVPLRITQPASIELRLASGATLLLPADANLLAAAIEAAARIPAASSGEDQSC